MSAVRDTVELPAHPTTNRIDEKITGVNKRKMFSLNTFSTVILIPQLKNSTS